MTPSRAQNLMEQLCSKSLESVGLRGADLVWVHDVLCVDAPGDEVDGQVPHHLGRRCHLLTRGKGQGVRGPSRQQSTQATLRRGSHLDHVSEQQVDVPVHVEHLRHRIIHATVPLHI